MMPRRGRPLVGSLMLLAACSSAPPASSVLSFGPGAAPVAGPLCAEPGTACAELFSTAPGSRTTHDAREPAALDWELDRPLLAEEAGLAAAWPRAALAQGPGPEFKPQQSWGATRLLFGRQQLDEEYWQPADEHLSVGFETAFERQGDWLGGEGGMFVTIDDGEEVYDLATYGESEVDTELKMLEVYVGLHRTFLRQTRLRPYVGAGGSALLLHGKQDIVPSSGPGASSDNKELTFGLYAHAGISFQIMDEFQIGVDYRVLAFTDVDVLTPETGDIDYQLFSIFLGFGG